jgi:hypothetical protein
MPLDQPWPAKTSSSHFSISVASGDLSETINALATADNFVAEIRLIPIPSTTYAIGSQDGVSLMQQSDFQV